MPDVKYVHAAVDEELFQRLKDLKGFDRTWEEFLETVATVQETVVQADDKEDLSSKYSYLKHIARR